MVDHVDVSVRESSFSVDALQLLKHVRPTWQLDGIRYHTFKEGISNILVGCFHESDPADIVLVRIYGKDTELFIDRKQEIKNIKRLSKSGFAAPLYATFLNGICYGFIPGDVLDVVKVRDPHVSRLIARTFVRLHTIPASGEEPRPILFPTLRRIYSLLPSSFSNLENQKRFIDKIPSLEHLGEEINVLEKHLLSLESLVVFCHNDALLKNVIYDEDRDDVWFIDYEYAGFNYQPFDIGNHFCEFAGVGDEDHSRYPDKSFQLTWLRMYLEMWSERNANDANQITEDDVERLYVQVNKFALASYLLWGIWALVQAEHSSLDFDFMGFAIGRLDQYFTRKDEFLSLKLTEAKA